MSPSWKYREGQQPDGDTSTLGAKSEGQTKPIHKKKNKGKSKKRPRQEAESATATLHSKADEGDSSQNGSSPGCKRQKIVEASSDDAQPNAARLSKNKKQKAKKKKRKKERRQKNGASSTVVENTSEEQAPSECATEPSPSKPSSETDNTEASFPFPTEPDDHCESPRQAYAHIQPLLKHLQSKLGSNLRIYDPYYCNGAVIENLAAIGFPSVYNMKEDCYQIWDSKPDYPDFDVFITNPPYSSDHIEKMMRHITGPCFGERPWFLLMPDWVHKKDYFISLTKSKSIQPFYVVPKKRYVYLPPKDFRAAKKSDVHKKSSPFNSMWYIWGGTRDMNDQLIHLFYSKSCTFPALLVADKESSAEKGGVLSEACDLARSKSALRDLRRKVKKR